MRFGLAIEIEGDRVLIGAPKFAIDAGTLSSESEAGMVAFFQLEPSGWVEQQLIFASDAREFHDFGQSLDVDGDVMAVGSGDAEAYIFEFNGSTWDEVDKLALPSPSGGAPPGDDDEASADASPDSGG